MMAERQPQAAAFLPLGQTLTQVRRLLSIGHPQAWTLFVAPTTIVASAALASLPPLFVGRMVDALQQRDTGQTLRQLLLYVCVMVISGLIGLAANYTASVFREALARNLQLFLFAKLNRSRIDAISELTLGQIVGRIVGDIRALVTQLELSVLPALSSACALLTTVVIMFRLEWRLAIVALICSVVVLVPLRLARPHLAALQRQSSAATDDLYGAIAESASIAGLVVNRNASAMRRAIQAIAHITDRIRRLRVTMAVVSSLTGIGLTIAGMIGPVTVLGIGAYLVVHGQMTVGTMVSVLIFQSRLSAPIGAFSGLQMTFASIAVTVARILQVAELPEERGGSNEFALGDITMRGVSLTFGEREVLTTVDLDIPRGGHIALVGPSGSGKSSLAALLWRLRDPSSGEIEIGSLPIREFTLESLRDSVCIVSQESFILKASLLENIVLSREEYDADYVERVIDAVFLRDFANSLPQGLKTDLGERGFRMSGGERQRVCLARALMQAPQLLILDEALTGVDIEMERRIIKEVRRLFFDRTIVAITHRLDSIRDFDAVFVMERGAVAARGSPDLLYRDEHLRKKTAAWSASAAATNA
jgi:ATP-binding cassette subfamily B protein